MRPFVTLICLLLLFQTSAAGQSTFLQTSDHASALINRYEIRTGKLRTGIFSGTGPYSREAIVALQQAYDTLALPLSQVDRFNLGYLAAENLPWADSAATASKKPFLRHFYKSKANLLEINEEGFFLAVNPGFSLQAGHSNLDEKPLYTNSRAAEIRGQIGGRLGFYSFFSENQMRAARHEKAFRDTYRALPGAHFVKSFKGDGYDFFTASGYITFRLLPVIDVQFGQSRNFIGHGRRSLLLSDFATDYLFLKVNTRIHRFQYQNLFAELIDRYGTTTRPLPRKYLAAHYLGIDITDRLNIGLYESVVFHDNKGTGRGFDMHYLNPVIFYRSVEHQLGDPDKMLVGLNIAYIPVRDVKLYGQLMVNEFNLNRLLEGDRWAHNKYGFQLGAYYIDVAGISNLDLQLEYNRVRPYSYTHYAVSGNYPVNSYSHYNQHLAHPLGANFSEWIVALKAQPLPRLTIALEAIAANYGADSLGTNWGQNIFLDYRDAEQLYGNTVGQGIATSLLIAEASLSYQLRHNLFIDLDLRYRKLHSELPDRNSENLYAGGGIRLNLGKRRWEY